MPACLRPHRVVQGGACGLGLRDAASPPAHARMHLRSAAQAPHSLTRHQAACRLRHGQRHRCHGQAGCRHARCLQAAAAAAAAALQRLYSAADSHARMPALSAIACRPVLSRSSAGWLTASGAQQARPTMEASHTHACSPAVCTCMLGLPAHLLSETNDAARASTLPCPGYMPCSLWGPANGSEVTVACGKSLCMTGSLSRPQLWMAQARAPDECGEFNKHHDASDRSSAGACCL